MAILFTLRIIAKNLLRGSHRRNIFSYFDQIGRDLTKSPLDDLLVFESSKHLDSEVLTQSTLAVVEL